MTKSLTQQRMSRLLAAQNAAYQTTGHQFTHLMHEEVNIFGVGYSFHRIYTSPQAYKAGDEFEFQRFVGDIPPCLFTVKEVLHYGELPGCSLLEMSHDKGDDPDADKYFENFHKLPATTKGEAYVAEALQKFYENWLKHADFVSSPYLYSKSLSNPTTDGLIKKVIANRVSFYAQYGFELETLDDSFETFQSEAEKINQRLVEENKPQS